MRIIVCGGRDYNNQKTVNTVLYAIHMKNPITEIIEGGASGADTCARNFANKAGIKVTTVPAKWKELGNYAGFYRNNQMADMKPDLVVAFPGGKGTAMMIQIARKRDIPIKKIV